MLRLGNVPLDSPLVLAPMAGVTDRDFRLIVRRIGGVGLVTMEFIASRALVRGVARTLDLMHFLPEERPISIQIYGSDADTMAEAARLVEAMGADICDINMGCPANKILKGCSGCALMGDLELAARDRLDGAQGDLDPAHRQVPSRSRSRAQELPRARPDLRGDRRRRRRAPRPHRAPDVQRRRHGAMGRDRPSQGGGRHPGVRQRRHQGARRRAADDRGDRLRRSHDRSRRDQEPVDLPAGGRRSSPVARRRRRRSSPAAISSSSTSGWSPCASRRSTPCTSCASSPAGTPTGCPTAASSASASTSFRTCRRSSPRSRDSSPR